jgi:large subunit ribosomal protein L7/L12
VVAAVIAHREAAALSCASKEGGEQRRGGMLAWPGVNAAQASPHGPLPPRTRLARLALLTPLHVFSPCVGFMSPAAFHPTSKVAASKVHMSAVVDEIMEKLKKMTLLEASELVKAIEVTFDVDASAGGGGMMMMAAPGAGGAAAAAEPVEEQTEFNLTLESFPADKKIGIIKVVRELTGLGLKEAKDAVEKAPNKIKEGASKADCEAAATKLKEAGAVVSIK